jgi:ornithine cyclodeaminase
LALQLIKAHATVRSIEKVYVWGRKFEKAQKLSDQLKSANFETKVVEKIDSVIAEADIISCATLSEKPLIKGAGVKPGQHLDLVGSYQKHTREADDEAILKSSVFVDTLQGAPNESGDLFIPIQNGILKKEDIKADLFEMCQSEKGTFRNSETEITFFKSVGHALEDLAVASLAFERITS